MTLNSWIPDQVRDDKSMVLRANAYASATWQPDAWIPACAGMVLRASAYASATCRTNFPKFSPVNNFTSASGNVSSPKTTSSLLFMRPSFR